jgi:nitroreductase
MDLYEVMRTTPATRAFTDEPIDDQVLHRILDHARFAPSGGNRQGWYVIVVSDRATRERLRDLYVLGWREYAAHRRKGLVPFAARDAGRWPGPAVDLEEARRTPAPYDFADHLDTVPVMLVLVADLGALATMDNGLDRQSIIGGASVYPFAHNILLAARNEGLGGVMTSVIARQEPAVRELLGIPEGYAVAGLLALGRPQKQVKRLSRKPVEGFTYRDRFDGPPFRSGSA